MTRPPLISRVARTARKRLFALMMLPSDLTVLRQLRRSCQPQGNAIGEALARLRRKLPQVDIEWVMRIENERQNLLNRVEALVDGSLGQGGLYDNDKTVADACKVSKNARSALLLYLLVRTLKPRTVIELGTNVGISSAYLAAALAANALTGKLITLDASAYRQRIAKEIHHGLGLSNITYVEGLFTQTLGDTLRKMGTIDLAFIDGHHQYEPTLSYLEEILPFTPADAVLVFDDIRWSEGMRKVWTRLQEDQRFGVVIDLYSMGICLRRRASDAGRLVLSPIYIAL